MKKIVFMFLILSFFVLSFTQSLSFAQEELSIKGTAITPSPQKSNKKVEYQLPYPGLLPDSPLYFTKVLRDAIVDFLISDPLKKADFYLLQADKRLNAGVYLFTSGKHKQQLAESTISKGENYFEKAIEKAKAAKIQGMDINDIGSRLLTAAKKHQEIILDLEKNADPKTRESLTVLLKRAVGFEKQAKSLILR